MTSAAGKTGPHTAMALLDKGFPVRAMVHHDDARAAELRDRGGVQRLTGRAPKSMETIARRCPTTMPGTTRGLSGMASAITTLTKAMPAPAPNTDRYLRMFQDGKEIETLAVDSPTWHATHNPDRQLAR
ncbi:hypothetical protein B4U45_22650 [Mycobacterium persicum]|uniref:Uncharacterized protein n=5 Tax=Mycobacterium TaxID=1763 RepID=A0A7G1IGQ8_MYCKA|nr:MULTISPECIES: hypothetical protein [Mycobacterium]RUP05943.1 MAG: hypothetical protein EKK34_05550 [Mycobacterium sp.]KZS85349.1 hypothetical protein A4G31_27110 [Mycobacterium persicum]MCA2334210.1 hypothetical protein [Mycobacterium avium]MCQ4363648.1 hypothetical protein [Mycobacterium gordonae]MDP7736153.1 hypothetical protein [Mycobacterium paragordonae]